MISDQLNTFLQSYSVFLFSILCFIKLSSCFSLIDQILFYSLFFSVDVYVKYLFLFYSHSSFWILISVLDPESLWLINSFILFLINTKILECFNSITTITNNTHPNPIFGILNYILHQKFSLSDISKIAK